MARFALRTFAILLGIAAVSGCDYMPEVSGSKEEDPLSSIERDVEKLPDRLAVKSGAAHAEDDGSGEYRNWYPSDITPPPGTRYSCPITVLPAGLRGIPPSDRGYINHTFAMILKLIHAKLVLIQSFGKKADMPRVAADYEAVSRAVAHSIDNEAVPEGLDGFHDSIRRAIDYQLQWERESIQTLSRNGHLGQILTFPSRKAVSKELSEAGKALVDQYPEMSAGVAHSLRNHLCSLDIPG